jgi:uncharacterized protein YtpQ (UPF0354 family)
MPMQRHVAIRNWHRAVDCCSFASLPVSSTTRQHHFTLILRPRVARYNEKKRKAKETIVFKVFLPVAGAQLKRRRRRKTFYVVTSRGREEEVMAASFLL